MPYTVDFDTVSTVGLGSSPVPAALAGLRAHGLVGILLAYWITHVLSSLPLPSQIPLEFNCRIDLHVLVITMATALVAGIGFGLAPALSSTRTDIGITLKEGAQAPRRGYRRFGLRNLFVSTGSPNSRQDPRGS